MFFLQHAENWAKANECGRYGKDEVHVQLRTTAEKKKK
jgi:hypothetical protein